MTDYRARVDRKVAQDMLDAFTSAGADSFDLTITTRQGGKHRFQRQQLSSPVRNARNSAGFVVEPLAGMRYALYSSF